MAYRIKDFDLIVKHENVKTPDGGLDDTIDRIDKNIKTVDSKASNLEEDMKEVKNSGVEVNKILVDGLNSLNVPASVNDSIRENANKVNDIKIDTELIEETKVLYDMEFKETSDTVSTTQSPRIAFPTLKTIEGYAITIFRDDYINLWAQAGGVKSYIPGYYTIYSTGHQSLEMRLQKYAPTEDMAGMSVQLITRKLTVNGWTYTGPVRVEVTAIGKPRD